MIPFFPVIQFHMYTKNLMINCQVVRLSVTLHDIVCVRVLRAVFVSKGTIHLRTIFRRRNFLIFIESMNQVHQTKFRP